MAKIEITFEHVFTTEPLEITEDFKKIKLDGARSKQYFEKCAAEDMAIMIVGLNEDMSDAYVGIEVKKDQGKKNSDFHVSLNELDGTLRCSISGKFVVSLRAGVLELIGGRRDFRIQGVGYKGGSYRGFMACVKNQEEGSYHNWLTINPSNIVLK